MQQYGLKLTNSTIIDSLLYSYQGGSNKLAKVSDGATADSSKLGDFKDGTNLYDDYSYDVNGNMVADSNKHISGIHYNHLNLPDTITVTGKGTIVYTYDAKGTRLQKTVTEGTVVTKTTYLSGFVYRNDTLQLVGHEEGRIRPPSVPGDTAFVYDYFVKDHLGNTRMVLTTEAKTDTYPAATMEVADSTTEQALYANVNTTRTSPPRGYPTDTTTTPNNYISMVQATAGYSASGPAIVLKVMSGDKFNVKVSSWYNRGASTPGTPVNIFSDLLSALTGGVAGLSGTGGHSVTQSQLTGGSILNSALSAFVSSQNGAALDGPPSNVPKAFLNWVLFDEQFHMVSSGSGFDQVGANNTLKHHVKSNMPVTSNGYLYIYVSNATPNIPVYFDNLQVTHIRGPLLQEDHYYPHGLGMAGISSKAFTTAAHNVYKANASSQLGEEEWADGSGLELYETPARSYDAQIGRFGQVDPLGEETAMVSEYAFVGNDPVSLIDPTGLTGNFWDWLGPIWEQSGNYGGQWHADKAMDGGGSFNQIYHSDLDVFASGQSWLDQHNAWGSNGWSNSLGDAKSDYYAHGGRDGSINSLPTSILVHAANGNNGLYTKSIEYFGFEPWFQFMNNDFTGLQGKFMEDPWEFGEKTSDYLKYADYLEVAADFAEKSRFISGAGKLFGVISKVNAPLEIANNWHKYDEHKITGVQFAYRTTGTVVSLATPGIVTYMAGGAEVAGPWGAVAGLVVGLSFVGAEELYDDYNEVAKPGFDSFTSRLANINSDISNHTWWPGQ